MVAARVLFDLGLEVVVQVFEVDCFEVAHPFDYFQQEVDYSELPALN